jgi:DnaK suppressor protein
VITDYTNRRAELEALLNDRIARTERIEEDLSQPGDDDWEERAVELEDDETLSSMGNLSLSEIEQIKHALYCIDHGTYGTCTRCGATIAPERLELIPFATTCVTCA